MQVPSFEWRLGGPGWFLLEWQPKKCGCVFQEIGNLVLILLWEKWRNNLVEPLKSIPSALKPTPWVFYALVTIISLSYLPLGLWNNDFHYLQHPDEPGKIEQILENSRNLHHPLLMLNSVALAARIKATVMPKRFESRFWLAKRFSPGDCARLGRQVSALFVTMGILFSAWAMLLSGQHWPAVFAALFLVMNQTLVWVGHFLKEDASLLFGVGSYLLAAAWLMRQPSRWRFLFLGVAAALLVSAKWAGALMLAGHWVGIFAFKDTRPLFRGFGWTLLAGMLTFSALNYQLFSAFTTASGSFASEITRLDAGRSDTGNLLATYRFWFLDLMTHEPGTLILPATLVGLVLAGWGKLGPAARTVVFLFAAYVFSLGLTPIPSQRYFVPAAFAVLYFAGAGVGAGVSQWSRIPYASVRISVAGALAIYLAGATVQAIDRTSDMLRHFRDPSVVDAWAWIRENLADKPVALSQLGRLSLPGQGRVEDPEAVPLPVRLLQIDTRGLTYDSLKAAGVTHLLFRSVDRVKSLRGKGMESDFFLDLDARGRRVFHVMPGQINIIQSGTEIYEIR